MNNEHLIDSHCHLNSLDLTRHDGGLDAVISAAAKMGVHQLLNVCIDLDSFPQVLEVAEQYPQVYASVGLHPNCTVEQEPTVEQLIALSEHPKIVAIGETGLDYYRSEGDLTWQQNRFRCHIDAAKQTQKPLIIHTRQAREDTIKIMKEKKAEEVRGVMHCFTETWEMAQQAMELGFYISFSGIVTFKNADAIREVVKKVPLNRILVETDAPYLTPVPYRGKPNEPGFTRYTAECIAELKQLSFAEVAAATTQNCIDLFQLS